MMDLNLVNKHEFQLELENSVIKTNRDEIAVKKTEQGLIAKKITLQENDLPRDVESRRRGWKAANGLKCTNEKRS